MDSGWRGAGTGLCSFYLAFRGNPTMRSTNRNDVELAVRRLDQVALAADIPYPHWLGGPGADQGPSDRKSVV